MALSSTNHAKLYGLYPRKGAIAIGSDADIVIWDGDKSGPILQSGLHHGADYTPYEGLHINGWPILSMLRGSVVMEDGEPTGATPIGQHLARDRSPLVDVARSLNHSPAA